MSMRALVIVQTIVAAIGVGFVVLGVVSLQADAVAATVTIASGSLMVVGVVLTLLRARSRARETEAAAPPDEGPSSTTHRVTPSRLERPAPDVRGRRRR